MTTNVEQFHTRWAELQGADDERYEAAVEQIHKLRPDINYWEAPEYEEMVTSQSRFLSDGIYDLTDLEYLVLEGQYGRLDYHGDEKQEEEKAAEALAFMLAHPNFRIGSAYETMAMVLIAERPPEFEGEQEGSDMNYGATVVLTNCPKTLLILAEND